MQLFFPAFFCGPINTYENFSHNIDNTLRFDLESIIKGIKLFFWALLKISHC